MENRTLVKLKGTHLKSTCQEDKSQTENVRSSIPSEFGGKGEREEIRIYPLNEFHTS